jgi:hypothetical protein
VSEPYTVADDETKIRLALGPVENEKVSYHKASALLLEAYGKINQLKEEIERIKT